jgi:hypothetical protein
MECGAILKMQISPICIGCLEKRNYKILRNRELEAWTAKPPKELVLSKDARKSKQLYHLVLMVDRQITYCGQKATQPGKMRRRVAVAALPEMNSCPDCMGILRRIQNDGRPSGAPGVT